METIPELIKYMIENKLFESREVATKKLTVLYITGSLGEADYMSLTAEVNKFYPAAPIVSPAPTPVTPVTPEEPKKEETTTPVETPVEKTATVGLV